MASARLVSTKSRRFVCPFRIGFALARRRVGCDVQGMLLRSSHPLVRLVAEGASTFLSYATAAAVIWFLFVLPALADERSERQRYEVAIEARFFEATSSGVSPAGGQGPKAAVLRHELELDDSTSLAFVRAVNAYVNSAKYIPDLDAYGQLDHWASLGEFVANGGGDSEDFAIAKYTLLVEMGFDAEKLTIVARQSGDYEWLCHVFLVVKFGDRELAFDHRSTVERLVDDSFKERVIFVAGSAGAEVVDPQAIRKIQFRW